MLLPLGIGVATGGIGVDGGFGATVGDAGAAAMVAGDELADGVGGADAAALGLDIETDGATLAEPAPPAWLPLPPELPVQAAARISTRAAPAAAVVPGRISMARSLARNRPRGEGTRTWRPPILEAGPVGSLMGLVGVGSSVAPMGWIKARRALRMGGRSRSAGQRRSLRARVRGTAALAALVAAVLGFSASGSTDRRCATRPWCPAVGSSTTRRRAAVRSG
ncbi:MAG: hypothetical protein JWN20_618 [Jatrophihabitantaceae bacterium]|nr:hypothetical protein [Jatrophihabitantaceae bacterium]